MGRKRKLSSLTFSAKSTLLKLQLKLRSGIWGYVFSLFHRLCVDCEGICACRINSSPIQEWNAVSPEKQAKNRRASRVFLFALRGSWTSRDRPRLAESHGVCRLLRNNRRVRGRPLNPYVVRTPSRFPRGRERAMKSTRTTTTIVRQRRHLVPRVTFVKGLLGFSPRSFFFSLTLSSPLALSFSLCRVVRLFRPFSCRTHGERVPNYPVVGRRLIARLLLPVNCVRVRRY